MRQVKGAMKAYIIFEFLSIFAVNVSCLFRLRINRDNNLGFSQHFRGTMGESNSDATTVENANDLMLMHLLSRFLERVNDIFLTMRKSFIILIIFDAYNILCKPFDFHEYMTVVNIAKRYSVAIICSLVSHVVHVFQALSLAVAACSTAESFELNYRTPIIDIFDSMWVQVTGHAIMFSAHVAMIVFGSIKCNEISKSLRDMDRNKFDKNPHCVTLYKMSAFLITTIAASVAVELGLKISFAFVHVDITIMPPERESWIMMGKAVFDTVFGISIMISFLIMFPRLRPGAIKQ